MDTHSKQQDVKRNFNKKKWRETQYSHKQKVSEWENKRKQVIQRKYNRMLRKEDGALHSRLSNPRDETSFKQTLDELNPVGPSRPMPQVRLSEFQRAKQEFERIRKLKEEVKLEKEQKRKEREEAILKSKQIRLERIKKLTKKTKKGQPVMKGRIEILLEKIQKQVAKDDNDT